MKFLAAALLLAPAVATATASTVFAQEKTGGNKAISGEIKFELHNDWATHSSSADNERNDTFAKIEAMLEARLAPSLALKSQITFDAVTEPEPGKDRFFGDQGAFLEQIYLDYTRDSFAVRGGKFGQKFGIAWDVAPGIWGNQFAEGYELAEQMGLAVDYNFGSPEAGKHVVTAGTYFADTTVLSESVITNRHRTRHAAGGAGNTEGFSNYSLALEGGEIKALPGLVYHLAYISRDTDAAGEKRETGLAGAIQTKFRMGTIEVVPLVEYATFVNRSGVSGTDADFLTTAAQFNYGKWNLALSRTGRSSQASGAAKVDDTLAQVTAGYAFDSGIGVNAGYRTAEESGVTTDTIGVLVDYVVKF
jgi:hypothetical protein